MVLPWAQTLTAGRSRASAELEAAFVDFYLGSYRRIVGQLVAVTGSQAEAEDISQEAFLQAARRWSTVVDYDAPEAWVRRIAVNLAVSGRRRATRRARALVRLAASTAESTDPTHATVDRLALSRALQAVGWRYRVVLALHYFADLPVAEIAAELGVPEATVKTRLARGRRQLGVLLTEPTAAPDDQEGS
jgi:RNA polymerase sigma-70 factor, ECF subfamily